MMGTFTVPGYCCCCYCNNHTGSSPYPLPRFTNSSLFVPFTLSFILFLPFCSLPLQPLPSLHTHACTHTHIIMYTQRYFLNQLRANWRLVPLCPQILQCVFLKNKDILLYKHSTVTKMTSGFFLPTCLCFLGSGPCLVTECQMALSHQVFLLEKNTISRMKLHGQ